MSARLVSTGLYAMNVVVSYLLMLAVMTYNVGYFLAIVTGLALGHFLFQKTVSVGPGSDTCCTSSLVDLDA